MRVTYSFKKRNYLIERVKLLTLLYNKTHHFKNLPAFLVSIVNFFMPSRTSTISWEEACKVSDTNSCADSSFTSLSNF